MALSSYNLNDITGLVSRIMDFFYSEDKTTFRSASQTGMHQGTLEIVIQKV